MGSIRKLLSKKSLPDREGHHSRLFIDLAENIHIHHREYRTVFGLEEYFEYVDLINRSTFEVRNYLLNNPEYVEGAYPTTIMVGGGRAQQLKHLRNSPAPNASKYFNDEMAIELQDDFVTDEIHIHFRDFRIAMNIACFKKFADCVDEAKLDLEEYLINNDYTRKFHADRIVADFNARDPKEHSFDIKGVSKIPLKNITSFWYSDITREFRPNRGHIKMLVSCFQNGIFVPPILVCRGKNHGSYFIVDGHHRFVAAIESGLIDIDTIFLDLNFEQTEKIRTAEVLLKEFDIETGYKFSLSNYLKDYYLFKANRYYRGHLRKIMFRNTIIFRILRKIKHRLFGREAIFKSFNERFNSEE